MEIKIKMIILGLKMVCDVDDDVSGHTELSSP